MPYEENEKYDGEYDRVTPHRKEDEVSASDLFFDGGGAAAREELDKADEKYYGQTVKIKLETNRAVVPTKGSAGAAAFDVYAPKRVELKPGKTEIVSLEFRVEIPEGYELKVLPRSGLSTKGVVVRNSPGTIDEDYRGEVGVILKYEPETLCQRVDKLYTILANFCKNLVSANPFHLDEAKARLLDGVANNSFDPFVIEKGDRIGQLQLQKVEKFRFVEEDELSDTTRGEGGFGSTGK